MDLGYHRSEEGGSTMGDELHDLHYPNESAEYRKARNELLEAEAALRQQIEQVAQLRRRLPLGGAVPEDYVFDEVDLRTGEVTQTRLSELFAEGQSSLALYSFMYGPGWEAPCPLCNSIADGLNGFAQHVTPRMGLAVVSQAPPDTLYAWAQRRGWTGFRWLSAHRNSYQADYLAQQGGENTQWPILNVFVRRDGDVRHFWGSELFYVPAGEDQHTRHVDLIWPMWHLFDVTPEGRGDWLPKLTYE
jgi:predicted dithiol-disulfide oxidoreductase (DUF899 family)